MFFDSRSWYGLSRTFWYREVFAVPVVILVLWWLWMKIVRMAFREEREGEGEKNLTFEL